MALHPHDIYPQVVQTRNFRDSVHQSGRSHGRRHCALVCGDSFPMSMQTKTVDG